MSMYRKYLLKKNFWRSNNAYVKHDPRAGGIYAYIQENGVKVVANNETHIFSNFNELDLYLDQLMSSTRAEGSEIHANFKSSEHFGNFYEQFRFKFVPARRDIFSYLLFDH